jgi:hypothetical protein
LFDFSFWECFSFFHLKSTPRGTKLTTIVASNVRSMGQFKFDF